MIEKFKVGEEVAVQLGSGQRFLSKVVRVTPSGVFNIEGYPDVSFGPDGWRRKRGNSPREGRAWRPSDYERRVIALEAECDRLWRRCFNLPRIRIDRATDEQREALAKALDAIWSVQ